MSGRFLRAALLCSLNVTALHAQGVTGAAIEGRVLDRDSMGIEGATVLVTNTANGERWQAISRGKGRYSLEQLSIGGPYRVDVRAVGFAPARRAGVSLGLGQRLVADFVLETAAYELEAIIVDADVDPRINAGRTGPAHVVTQSTIARVPVADRDFSRLALLSPHVTVSPSGGLSIDGQPDRLNAVQIDGATDADLLGSSGPGGIQVLGARRASVESIRELEVISAPFDVRFGNFAAGLVNAVTKSGTNRFEGSLSTYYSDRDLVGKDADGGRGDDFENMEVGVNLGGPIVRDRAAFFVDAGIQRRTFPESAPLIGADPTAPADTFARISYATALRFQNILRDTYGVDPGGFRAFPSRLNGGNVLGKLTLQAGVNSRLELSHSYAHSVPRLVLDRNFPAYSLTSTVFSLPVTVNLTRLTWISGFRSGSINEFVLARLRQGFRCVPSSVFPAITVATELREVTAGSTCPQAAIRSQDSEDQHLLEITDNLTVATGSHRLTFGTHSELIHLRTLPPLDYFFTIGWTFSSLDSLESGQPDSYGATLRSPARPTGPLSDERVTQLGVYVQDQWNPRPRLTMTAGIRLDVPFLSRKPVVNPTLGSELGIDNTRTPSGHVLWSPRLGINYDWSGDGTTYLRGGIGLFAGRPAYKWFVAVDAHSGLEALYLSCTGPNVPAFTIDPDAQPTTCGGGIQPSTPLVTVFDPAFRFPRNLKLALGADHKFHGGLVATIDLLYTRAVNQYDLVDLNLTRPSTAAGEGGRPIYGTADSAGNLFPARRSLEFGPVIEVRNAKGNHAFSATALIEKHFANGTEIAASYTYARSKDRLSPSEDNTDGDVDLNLLDGTLEHRNVRTSLWQVPHRITLLTTANLPLGLRFSLFYEGRSGTPFTYGIAGDANGDGYPDDDIAYVPVDARPGGDVNLVVLDTLAGMNVPAPAAVYDSLARFIREQGCLRAQRGRIMRRNSCRAPWSSRTEARITKVVPTFDSHELELTLDVFNPLHLLKHDWGTVHGADDRLLEMVGYDAANERGVYRYLAPSRILVDEDASRWRLQLGVRYSL